MLYGYTKHIVCSHRGMPAACVLEGGRQERGKEGGRDTGGREGGGQVHRDTGYRGRIDTSSSSSSSSS